MGELGAWAWDWPSPEEQFAFTVEILRSKTPFPERC